MKKIFLTTLLMLTFTASVPAQGLLGKLAKAAKTITETVNGDKPVKKESKSEETRTSTPAAVTPPVKAQTKYLENPLYTITVAPDFDVTDVCNMGGEHFAIRAGGKLTYYRMNGETVSNVVFDDFESVFEDGYCVVRKDGKYGILKDDGTLKMLTYRNVGPFTDGLAVANIEYAKDVLIDHSGKVVYTGRITKIGRLYCGRRLFYDDQKMRYGYMDAAGKIVIPAKYAQAGNFSDNVAFVKDDRFSGSRYLINTSGVKQPLDCSAYSRMTDFVGGKCVATIEMENQRVIDKAGNVLMQSTSKTPRFWMSALDDSGEIFYENKPTEFKFEIWSDLTGKTCLDIGDMESQGFRPDAFDWDRSPYVTSPAAANLHSLRFINDSDIPGASYLYYFGQKNSHSMVDMTIGYDFKGLYTVGNSNKRLFLIKLPDTPVIEFVKR